MIRNDVTNVMYVTIHVQRNYTKTFTRAETTETFYQAKHFRVCVGAKFLSFFASNSYCFLFPNNVIRKRLIKTPQNFPTKFFFKKEDETYLQLR